MTAAGGMGRCICGLDAAFKAYRARTPRRFLSNRLDEQLRDAFAAGWFARDSSGGSRTLTVTGALPASVVFDVLGDPTKGVSLPPKGGDK